LRKFNVRPAAHHGTALAEAIRSAAAEREKIMTEVNRMKTAKIIWSAILLLGMLGLSACPSGTVQQGGGGSASDSGDSGGGGRGD
jgi:hypothetical protein